MTILTGQGLDCRRSRARTLVAAILVFGVVGVTQTLAQLPREQSNSDVLIRIKEEELKHSQVMDMVGYLTDVIGPRLTGSPNLRKAQEYAVSKTRGWGLANSHLEAWGPFGRGWSLEAFTANILAPGFSSLIAYPKAWSPGTNGILRGEVVLLDIQTPADQARYKGKLAKKIVLLGPARAVDPNFAPLATRTSDEELLKLANAKTKTDEPAFQMSPAMRARQDLNYQKWQLLYDEGAAVVVEAGSGDGGVVYVTRASIPSPVDTPSEQRPQPWALDKPRVIPQVVVAAEQYNRIVRVLGRGLPVQMEVNIEARFYEQDPMSYNVIAEIPGSDLKDEVVMVGGCLDSWHAGTGATDNAAGAAVVMEVLRLLKTLNLQPRRTIRIALWSAEEQGALGSRAYVAAHFATRTSGANSHLELKPEYEKVSGYFNLDYGTGKIRGIYLQGNEVVKPIFGSWLAPLKDMGAATLTIEGVGATDHNSFDAVGLPGFQFIRDYMETNTRTAHTNMDVYDHVLEEDLKQSAIVATWFIYQAAMRDEKLPRKALKQ